MNEKRVGHAKLMVILYRIPARLSTGRSDRIPKSGWLLSGKRKSVVCGTQNTCFPEKSAKTAESEKTALVEIEQ
ncbi:MAG: hypothetical protein LUG17_03175, partial [Clostridiales bacterium]|nr:hypothetical protein [Clostridiales bacterium]